MDTHLPALPPESALAELLPDPLDPVLTRPLALHQGRAYAAAWPLIRLPGAGPAADDPEAEPQVERRLFLIRDDGHATLPALATGDALIRLAAYPPLPAGRLWSSAGLDAYRTGYRPDPAAVFHTLTAVLDTFIDFTGSLADQTAVCEYLAAYVLATWFLPAFTTFSHLWILGDTGAGKTRLLHLLARLTHLGVVIPPSAPLSALRDLAALGAGLAIDNADGLFATLTTGLTYRPAAASQRQGLFLSGARRDVLFPLRQRLNAVRGVPAVYGLTHADVFGPRLFAAQRPPASGVLARAVLLPLLRSPDRARCAADPDDPAAWPISPRALLDDLWALSLAHLAEFPAHVAAAVAAAPLVSAGFQNWHPVLAVGHWLAAHGLPDLPDRLRALGNAYPRQTLHLAPQAADLTALTLFAIYGLTAYQIEKVVTFAAASRPASGDSGDSVRKAGDSDDSVRKADDSDDSTQKADDSDDSTRKADDSDDSTRKAGDSDDSTREADDSDDSTRKAGDSKLNTHDGNDLPPASELDPALIATLNQMHFSFSASLLLPVIQGQARHRAWDDLADHLTPSLVGQTLTSLRLEQTRTKTSRQYTVTLAQLARFIDAYRLTLPDILTAYTTFREDTLRATLPPGSPGAPLQPPSPAVAALLLRLLRPQPHPENQP